MKDILNNRFFPWPFDFHVIIVILCDFKSWPFKHEEVLLQMCTLVLEKILTEMVTMAVKIAIN